MPQMGEDIFLLKCHPWPFSCRYSSVVIPERVAALGTSGLSHVMILLMFADVSCFLSVGGDQTITYPILQAVAKE
jgi:arginase family enzyme